MSNDEDFAKALEVLNTAYQTDPAAIHALVSNSVPCQGVSLRDHPWVVVGDSYAVPGTYTVSSLGLLNGVIHILTGKRIAMAWTDVKDENGRFKFLGFVEYKEPEKKG
jgi:hypothetical protein